MTDDTKSTFEVYNGSDGRAITSIERTSGTSAAGTTDTYTITFSDNTTFDFSVYNGADGIGAGDMLKSIYDPQNKNTDVFLYVDDQIGPIDTRIGQLDTKVEEVDNHLGQLDTKVEQTESQLGQLNTKIDQVDTKIGQIDTLLDSINGE
jgi:peptidoglycan hydrolase CwlO-like protein